MPSPAPSLVLHQYDTSPFSEKIRKVLAHKDLAWAAVEQPSIMPKPDLIPLTGGYRRIPVLQIGADVWCDTQCIVRTIERLHPAPTLYPGGTEGTAHAWNLWADKLVFMPVVAAVFAEIGTFVPPAFIEDRSRMMPGRRFEEIPQQAPHARAQLAALLSLVEAQLADGRPWLLGDAFSLADAAVYHTVWFLRVAPQAAAVLLEPLAGLRAWAERVGALGDGRRTAMSPADALAVARAAEPAPPRPSEGPLPEGCALGTRVAVTPDDYGFDPVVGELVYASTHEVAVRRSEPSLGAVVVHFPRIGFRVEAAG